MSGSDRVTGPPDDLREHVRLTVSGVAARLGVAAPTLRTWARRYGLGPSEHEAGRHRRYDAHDLARLETMRRLTLDGVAPADAAQIALRGNEVSVPGESGGVTLDREARQDAEPVVADPLTVAAAAVDGDHQRLARLLGHANAENGILDSWVMTVRPALEMLLQRTTLDRPGHDPETALRAETIQQLSIMASQSTRDRGHVIVHGGDRFRTDAHVLAAELATHGVSARVTHPRVERGQGPGLTDLVARRPGTIAVLLGESDQARQWVEELCADGHRVFLIALTDEIPPCPGLYRARTLTGGVHEILSLLAAGEEQGSLEP